MKAAGGVMKLLKIQDNSGHYLKEDGDYSPVDKIDKNDLLQLVHWTLHEQDVDLDDYDENLIKNQAHQVIYKSVARKLRDLRERRQEYIDESARIFLDDYEKYRGMADSPQGPSRSTPE
jgi:hypothetical protein